MSDIIEQLRRGIQIKDIGKDVVSMFIHPEVCDVAADEITRLREENERLERENRKNRVALLRIQCIAQDITRPVPFQEEDDEN